MPYTLPWYRSEERLDFFNIFKISKLLRHRKERNYLKKHKKLRVNIVLNNKEDPVHDTTNTCSCDCGVRAAVQNIARVSEASAWYRRRGHLHIQSKVCKARPGQSARTTTGNSRSNSAGSARRKDAESLALPASETAVSQKSDLPSSASGEDHALHAGFGASVHHTGKRRQQRNREGNS